MSEMKQGNSLRPGARKKRRRGTLRLSVILLIFICSIIISFISYYFHFDISSKPNPDFVSKDSSSAQVLQNAVVTDTAGNTVTDSSGNAVTEPAVTEENQTSENESNGISPVKESEKKDDSYLDTCVFIGDSITSGFANYKFVSYENVFASVGLNLKEINTAEIKTPELGTVSVLDGLRSKKPENVYILLGSNGIAWLDNDSMITDYSSFIDSIKEILPESDIYIMSVTPVGTMKENKPSVEEGKLLNTQIDSFNLRLADLAAQKNVYYLDINSGLKGPNGKLPDDVTSDGMHLDKATYGKVIDYILTHTV